MHYVFGGRVAGMARFIGINICRGACIHPFSRQGNKLVFQQCTNMQSDTVQLGNKNFCVYIILYCSLAGKFLKARHPHGFEAS